MRARSSGRSRTSRSRSSEGEVVGFIGQQRLRQVHAVEDPHADHRADRRARSQIRGRVGSLLEVGTGFHPELTGRENIFLNGAILGMTRARDPAQVRRDRRVRRRREVHRHPGEALLERHVRAARLRGRGAPRARDPDRRRGARGRRRRVPAALHGPDRGHLELGAHGDLRVARHAGGHAALQPRVLAPERPPDRRGRRGEVVSRYLQEASGTGAERSSARRRAGERPRSAPVGPRRRLNGDTIHAPDVREPVGVELASSSWGRPARCSRS